MIFLHSALVMFFTLFLQKAVISFNVEGTRIFYEYGRTFQDRLINSIQVTKCVGRIRFKTNPYMDGADIKRTKHNLKYVNIERHANT